MTYDLRRAFSRRIYWHRDYGATGKWLCQPTLSLKGTKGNGSDWLLIAVGYGAGVMIPAMMFGAISGNVTSIAAYPGHRCIWHVPMVRSLAIYCGTDGWCHVRRVTGGCGLQTAL